MMAQSGDWLATTLSGWRLIPARPRHVLAWWVALFVVVIAYSLLREAASVLFDPERGMPNGWHDVSREDRLVHRLIVTSLYLLIEPLRISAFVVVCFAVARTAMALEPTGRANGSAADLRLGLAEVRLMLAMTGIYFAVTIWSLGLGLAIDSLLTSHFAGDAVQMRAARNVSELVQRWTFLIFEFWLAARLSLAPVQAAAGVRGAVRSSWRATRNWAVMATMLAAVAMAEGVRWAERGLVRVIWGSPSPLGHPPTIRIEHLGWVVDVLAPGHLARLAVGALGLVVMAVVVVTPASRLCLARRESASEAATPLA
jgi:hypothetical protein